MVKEFLTYADVARLLQCTPRHISNLAKNAGLPTVKVGKCVRIDVRDLDEFLEANKRREVADDGSYRF